MIRRLAAVAFLCATVCPTVSGQTADIDTTRVGPTEYLEKEVLIKAPRPLTAVGGSSAVVADVDSLNLPAAPTLDEALRELPLLHVRTNSRGESEISARGSESRQVAVLVDGVPITLAWDARADVSVIPATAPQNIVFIRGLSSMLYGPNVLGGIVETRVGQPFHQPKSSSIQITTGADDVGTFGSSATAAIPVNRESGEWLIRGGLGYRNTPGQPLAAFVTQPVSTDPDIRLNTDATNVDGFFAVRHRAEGGTWFSVSGLSFEQDRGIAAELGVEEPRFWRYPHVSRTVAVVSGGTGDRESPFGGRGDIEASLGYDRGRTEIDSYTSAAYDEIDAFEDGRDRTLTVRLLGDQSLGPRGDLRSAFTLANIKHRENIPDGAFVYRQRLTSIGAETVWRLLGDAEPLGMTIGAAYDRGSTPEAGGRETLGAISEWGARVGFSKVLADGNWIVHSGISRRGRFPALRELYSGALNRFQPNPNLKPENLVAIEAGVTSELGDGQLQAVVFHHRLNDAVVRITLPDRLFMRVNRNELRSTGVELLGSQGLGPVEFSGNITIQNVDLTDTVAEETNRPENLPEAFGGATARIPLVLGIVGTAEVEYTGTQFVIDPNTGEDAELENATIFGGSVSRVFAMRPAASGLLSQVEARLSLDNIRDSPLFDAFGLPEPGRRLRFELRLF